jgi:hypothetical protein
MKVDVLRLAFFNNTVIQVIFDNDYNLIVGRGLKTISQTKIFSSSYHPIQRIKQLNIINPQALIEPFFFLEIRLA